jgi:tRNA(fMet)-specific endonuclease VapC
LKKQGKLINDADILIASIVKANNAVLVTNNEEHFSRVKDRKLAEILGY